MSIVLSKCWVLLNILTRISGDNAQYMSRAVYKGFALYRKTKHHITQIGQVLVYNVYQYRRPSLTMTRCYLIVAMFESLNTRKQLHKNSVLSKQDVKLQCHGSLVFNTRRKADYTIRAIAILLFNI
jgi:hypothetical protein